MIKKVVKAVDNAVKRFYLKIDNANAKVYVSLYKKMTDEELKKQRKELKEYIKNEKKRLQDDKIVSSLKTFERAAELVVVICVPSGTILVNVNRQLKPIKQAMLRLIAIEHLLKERKEEKVKESTVGVSIDLKELNGVQLIESTIENVEEHASMLVNYMYYNEPIMTTNDCSTILDKIKDIDTPETNVIKDMVQKAIDNNENGNMMLHDLYVNELRDRTIIPDNIKNVIDDCIVNPLSPDSSAISVFNFMCEANNNPQYASTLLTDIFPIAKRLVESNNEYIDLLGDLPDVIYKNIVEESNYSNLVPLRYLVNESTNADIEIDWYTDKMKECRALLDSKIREVCKSPELNKILDENIEYDEDLVKLVNRANKVYSEMVRESIYLLSQDEESELTLEQLSKVTKLCMTHQAILEAAGHQSLVWKAGHAIDKASRKVLNNGKGAYDTSGRNTSGISKAAQNIEKLINYPINKIIKTDKAERKDRIIEGRWRLKIWKLIRKAILGKMLYVAFGPISAAIGLMASVALDKKLDRRVRNEIVHEMETELRVINEKIEDAKGENDKKEKYQLMRLKDKLEKDIQRVKYGLNGKY